MSEIIDEESLVGQEEGGWGRKLPCNQNLELIFSMVAPGLVNKSAGLRDPGHQLQLSAIDNAEISMVP